MAPQKIEGPGTKEKNPGLAPIITSSKSRRAVASTANNGTATRDVAMLSQIAEGSNGQQAGAESAGGVS